MKLPLKFMLLGSGELGKEFVIAAQRLGCETVAVDRYADAPAMQVADSFEVISMLDGEALRRVITKHNPDFIVPEIEAIRTEVLIELEKEGRQIVPSARAVNLTMNRDRIRDMVSNELGIRTAKYAYASSLEELIEASEKIGYPNVVKPVMSSSGKGQSTVKTKSETEKAWNYALEGSRGDSIRVIVEEFINFESEITLLTIKQRNGETLFCPPIGHRQERGDYQESWQPCLMKEDLLDKAKEMARKVTDNLGGAGIFGVEFFLTKDEVIFSELSPRPHDTGIVTLISQNLNEFELHLRAVLGLPIPKIETYAPSASSVILSERELKQVSFDFDENLLNEPDTELRLFGKPDARPYRRMGVALAKAESTEEARKKANRVAHSVKVIGN